MSHTEHTYVLSLAVRANSINTHIHSQYSIRLMRNVLMFYTKI